MPKRFQAVSVFTVVAAIAFVAAGCDGLLSPGSSDDTANVTIESAGFSPAVDTVAVGTTVWWTNHDTGDHTVTSDTGAFYSATLHTNNRYPHTFSTPGSYTYRCLFNTSLHGTIVVE